MSQSANRSEEDKKILEVYYNLVFVTKPIFEPHLLESEEGDAIDEMKRVRDAETLSDAVDKISHYNYKSRCELVATAKKIRKALKF